MKKLMLHLICLFSFLLVISCNKEDKTVGTPKIQAGVAKITGKVKSPKDKIDDNSFVEFFVPHPVTGEIFKYKALIDQSGRFSADIEVETDLTLIGLHTSLKPYNSLLIKVRSGGVTDMDITYGESMEIEDVRTKPAMSKYDMIQSLKIINDMLGIYDSKPEPQLPLNDTSPEGFMKHIKTSVTGKLKILDQDSLLSKELKEILARDFRVWYYRVGAFDYERSIKAAYRNKLKDSTIIPQIQKIDRKYFAFLKDLDLNNPQYLICSSFADFQIEILKNNTLALPEIGDQDIPTWLASVKGILSDLVGFKDGQYYDILAANAYGRQLVKETRPLTEQQKKNIAAYWKDGEIGKILFRKNQEVVNK